MDNNFYTNAMAQMHLRFAAELVQWLADHHAGQLLQLQVRIGLDLREAEVWQDAARHMFLPYDGALRVHPQDDGFLAKPRWPFDGAADAGAAGEPLKRPLLLHYHPLVIYRHQICKQADVLLALLLLGEQFTPGRQAARLRLLRADHHARLVAVAMHLRDHRVRGGLPRQGVRATSPRARAPTWTTTITTAAPRRAHGPPWPGAWLGVVAGFAGLRMHKRMATFAPSLPQGWTRYGFKLRLAGTQLQLSVDAAGCTYRLLEGNWLALRHGGQTFVLGGDRTEMTLPLASLPAPAAVRAAPLAASIA